MRLSLMAFSCLSWAVDLFKCTDNANSLSYDYWLYITLLILTTNSFCCHASLCPAFLGSSVAS